MNWSRGSPGAPAAVAVVAGPGDSPRWVAALRGGGFAGPIFGGPAMGRSRFLREAGRAAEGAILPVLSPLEGVGRICGGISGPLRQAARLRCGGRLRCRSPARRRRGQGRLKSARIADTVRDLSPWTRVAGAMAWDPLGSNTRRVRLGAIRGGRRLHLAIENPSQQFRLPCPRRDPRTTSRACGRRISNSFTGPHPFVFFQNSRQESRRGAVHSKLAGLNFEPQALYFHGHPKSFPPGNKIRHFAPMGNPNRARTATPSGREGRLGDAPHRRRAAPPTPRPLPKPWPKGRSISTSSRPSWARRGRPARALLVHVGRQARRHPPPPDAQPRDAGALPEESVNFDTTQNLFIEGDNLEVLKLLYKPYFGRVKMIYIDPPYNTGNDFIYPDNFADPLDTYLQLTGQKDAEGNLLTTNPETSGRYHSAWLTMMYPRLFLARQLLREDGVIFVSIDDHEVHNLRMLMNEIFGEENFVAHRSSGRRCTRPDTRATSGRTTTTFSTAYAT